MSRETLMLLTGLLTWFLVGSFCLGYELKHWLHKRRAKSIERQWERAWDEWLRQLREAGQ